MVSCGRYKDRPAVTVESDELAAVFLPEDGAKLASLVRRRDGRELLAQRPWESYRRLAFDGEYISAECSGFDDMFPTVDPCAPGDGAAYPDHGECCRLSYEYTQAGDRAIFRASSRLFPIEYEKSAEAQEDGSILTSYRITNAGSGPFRFLWAGHIMLNGSDDMRVITPFAHDTPTELMFATAGTDADRLPRDRLMGHAPGLGAAYKFYYLERMPEGRFGASYGDGSSLIFEVDPEKLPYLGIWLNNGEFQGEYTVTPEPCTVPFDSPERASGRGLVSYIPAGGSFGFDIRMALKWI